MSFQTAKQGETYVGRASGYGTPQEVLKRRFSGGHHKGLDLKKTKIDKVSKSRHAIRGREHMVYERLQKLGKGTDQIAPISSRNRNKAKYIRAAIKNID